MVDVKAVLSDPPQWLAGPLAKAQASIEEGKTSDAMKALRELLTECRKSQHGDAKTGECVALLMMADASFRADDFEMGAQASSEALHIFQSMKNSIGQAAALTLVSKAYLEMGDVSEAVTIADEAVTLADAAGATKQVALANAALASAALASPELKNDAGMQARALEAAQAATSALRQDGDKTLMAEVVSDLSRAYLEAGNCNMALAKAKEAQRIYQGLMSVAGEAKALVLVSRALHKEGSIDAAISQAVDAAKLFESCGDFDDQAFAYALIGQYEKAGQQEKRDLTQRVIARLSASGADTETIQPYYIVPQKERELISTGPAMVTFKGFMGRAASVAAPQAAAKKQNRFLLYNVSW